MLSEKLLLRKWKALFSSIIAPLCVYQSICSPLPTTGFCMESSCKNWFCVWEWRTVQTWGFLQCSILQTALCSTLQWEDTWNFGWACRGSHPCLGSKTVIDAFCVKRNQTPFFFFGRLESTMHPWSTEPCLLSYECVHKLCLQDELYPLFCRTFVKQTFGEAVSWLVSLILYQRFTEPLCRDAW